MLTLKITAAILGAGLILMFLSTDFGSEWVSVVLAGLFA
jgi:hypothetical protein